MAAVFLDLPLSSGGTSDHTELTNIGTNTHAQIDTHISKIDTNLDIGADSASPNDTVTVSYIKAAGSATNIDIALNPKGTGAITAQIPDSGTGGGNKRGSNAVDLQMSRSAATQVASGANSFTAGIRNTASNGNTIAMGTTNTSSGANAVALGSGNTSSATAAFSVGQANVASGTQSVAMGYTCAASGAASLATGQNSNTNGVIGRRSHASGQNGVIGDSQFSRFGLRNSTTGNTPTVLTANAATAAATNIVVLQNNNSFYFKGEIVARESGSTNAAVWKVEGFVTRGTSAATTTLVTSSVTAYSNVPTWTDPAIAADTTLGGLTFTVTGNAATNIRWFANIDTVEIIYA